jgi:hypothetical protein
MFKMCALFLGHLVEWLRFYCFDLYIPVLTTTSLQCGRIAICREHDIHVPLSQIYRHRPWIGQHKFQVPQGHLYNTIKYWDKNRTLKQPWPCFPGVDNAPDTGILNFLLVRKEAISLMRPAESCNSDSLYNRPDCRVVSKAFTISKNTEAIDISLKFRVMWFVSLIHWIVVLRCARKTNWLAFSKSLSLIRVRIVFKISFLKQFHLVGKRLIRR